MTTTINGVQYNEVKRAAKVGEKIKVVDAFATSGEYRDGDVFEVISHSPETPERHASVLVKEHRMKILDKEYVVLEPIATAPSLTALETELAATKAKVAEMEAQLAEVKRAKAEAQRLKVGDYAKVVQSGHGNYGKIVKITRDDRPGQYVYGTEHLNGVGADIHTPSQLTRATDEEITEAKRKLAEKSLLTVGEYAKIVDASGHPFALGEIVVVQQTDYADAMIPYRVRDLSASKRSWVKSYRVVRATDEEVAEALRAAEEAKRKLEPHEVEAKWHAIGREVGEFKVGDVVKTLHAVGGHPVGTVGVIARLHSDNSHVIEANGERYYHTALELIAPVESVVNLINAS